MFLTRKQHFSLGELRESQVIHQVMAHAEDGELVDFKDFKDGLGCSVNWTRTREKSRLQQYNIHTPRVDRFGDITDGRESQQPDFNAV